MGVFKEHANAFEAVARKQKRIYNDAADYGYPYNTGNVPADIELLLHYVNDLKDTSLVRSRKQWGEGKNAGVEITIRIGWEVDEGKVYGTEYKISFQRLAKHPSNLHPEANAFISVYIKNYNEPYKKR